MNSVLKSRLKKVFWVALIIGIVATTLTGTLVWNGTNPEGEFHVDGVPTFNFIQVLILTFLPVTSAFILISSPFVYLFSRPTSKP